MLIAAGCNPSRDEADESAGSAPAVPIVIPIGTLPELVAPTSAVLTDEPDFVFPYDDYFGVDQLGSEPVRGSGCGVDEFIGEELPDGLWRGFVRAFDGLWVDASVSLDFDLACVYIGDAAVLARQRWINEHPGEQPVSIPDGFLVNDNDRARTVPLAADFLQVDAETTATGGCAPPTVLPPSGSTERFRLVDSWLFVAGGEAQWVVTGC